MKVLKSLKNINKYFKNHKAEILLLSIIILASSLISLLYTALWGFILDNLMQKKFFEAIVFLLLYLVFSILCVLVEVFARYLQAKLERIIIKDIQIDLFGKVIHFPAVAFEEHGVGEYVNRIYHDTDQLLNNFTKFVSLIGSLISVLVIVIVFIKINIILALEIIAFIIISILITKYFTPVIKKTNKNLKTESDILAKDSTQILTGIREVKALGIKNRITDIMNIKIKKLFSSAYENSILSTFHFAVEWIVYGVFEFIIIFTAAFLFYKEYIVFAVLVMVYNYLGRINYALSNYTEFIPSYQKLSVSLERLDNVINDKMYLPEQFGNNELKNVKGQIEFKNVNFKYANDNKLTLHNISLIIKPNIKTAIVGVSGSGKTSIFNLLLHYFTPTSGQILLDGVDLQDLSENTLRENIGVIRQDAFLFNMSIIDNFRMVKENVTLKEVRKVCKAAYIDSYIMDLPNGYNTIIGENGACLSGGQKQRLAIARTLLKDPKIILFDEATSALDNKSQEYIKKTINNLVKNHTIIIIAHRLSTIIDADEIILMDKGKIIAKGNHKKLLKNEKYKELYKPDIIR